MTHSYETLTRIMRQTGNRVCLKVTRDGEVGYLIATRSGVSAAGEDGWKMDNILGMVDGTPTFLVDNIEPVFKWDIPEEIRERLRPAENSGIQLSQSPKSNVVGNEIKPYR